MRSDLSRTAIRNAAGGVERVAAMPTRLGAVPVGGLRGVDGTRDQPPLARGDASENVRFAQELVGLAPEKGVGSTKGPLSALLLESLAHVLAGQDLPLADLTGRLVQVLDESEEALMVVPAAWLAGRATLGSPAL